MESITIRRMTIEDAEAVTDVLIKTWQTAYRGIVSDECLDHMDRPTLIERRKRQYKDYIVAVVEGRIVGFCWYVNDNSFSKEEAGIDSEIVAIYVLPESERNGVGRKMFSYAVDDLKAQGRKRMVIWCLKDNSSGRNFYEKMGGVIMGEHKTHIGNLDYDEVGFLFEL
ncbi:MAG: GNAT family N-acetyltransferase [Clostridiales bacterium]|nr:GNAT family N-acetyltransferase [Clostridiales bacterium]